MLCKARTITLMEEVFKRWSDLCQEAGADLLIVLAGRKLAEMFEQKVREEPGDPAEDARVAPLVQHRAGFLH